MTAVRNCPHKKERASALCWKILVTIFWHFKSILLINYLQERHTINDACYLKLLNEVKLTYKQKGEAYPFQVWCCSWLVAACQITVPSNPVEDQFLILQETHPTGAYTNSLFLAWSNRLPRSRLSARSYSRLWTPLTDWLLTDSSKLLVPDHTGPFIPVSLLGTEKRWRDPSMTVREVPGRVDSSGCPLICSRHFRPGISVPRLIRDTC